VREKESVTELLNLVDRLDAEQEAASAQVPYTLKPQTRSNRFCQILDLYWRSPESGDV